MSRLNGLVGEAGTGEARIRRSGAGDLDRGLPGQRSAQETTISKRERAGTREARVTPTLFGRQGGRPGQGAGGGGVQDPLSVLIVG